MKKIKFPLLLAITLIFNACGNQNNKKDKDFEEITTDINSQTLTEEYLQKLQGSWKRQSYPYGTIEFKNNQVRFNTGEGSAELPQFIKFELVKNCPNSKTNINVNDYDFYVFTENRHCDAIKFNLNSFEILFSGNKENILYKKIGVENDVQLPQIGDPSGRVLPLETGFYVLLDTDCENPPNASWRYWNGIGLSGSSTISCEMKLIRKNGTNFNVSQSCTNTYDKSKSIVEFTVKVSNTNSFTLIENGRSQTFKFCTSTPSWLKT